MTAKIGVPPKYETIQDIMELNCLRQLDLANIKSVYLDLGTPATLEPTLILQHPIDGLLFRKVMTPGRAESIAAAFSATLIRPSL